MSAASKVKSLLFVGIQFACLGLIAVSGPLFPPIPLLLLTEFLGIGLGLWAVFTIGIGRFNIAPDPLKWSVLVTRGPYRLIRHPMYLALLVTTLPLIIADPSLFRFAIWLVLLIDLLFKLNYEENLLKSSLDGYREYSQRSYRLIPLVY